MMPRSILNNGQQVVAFYHADKNIVDYFINNQDVGEYNYNTKKWTLSACVGENIVNSPLPDEFKLKVFRRQKHYITKRAK